MIFDHEPQPGDPHDDLARVVLGHEAIVGLLAEHAERAHADLEQIRQESHSAIVPRGETGTGTS